MAKETITRSQLAALPVLEQREAARTHEIINDPQDYHELQEGEIYRCDFDKLSVFEKHSKIKHGIKVVD